jgi:hypothetical protein
MGRYRGGDLGANSPRIDPVEHQVSRCGLGLGSLVGAIGRRRTDVCFSTSTVEPGEWANGATVERPISADGLTVEPPVSAGRLTVEPTVSAGAGCALDPLAVDRHTCPPRSPHLPTRLDDP